MSCERHFKKANFKLKNWKEIVLKPEQFFAAQYSCKKVEISGVRGQWLSNLMTEAMAQVGLHDAEGAWIVKL